MREATKASDLDTLARTAHSLRGALGNFFAQPASDAALALEDAAQSGDDAMARQALKNFEREIDRLKPHLIIRKRNNA